MLSARLSVGDLGGTFFLHDEARAELGAGNVEKFGSSLLEMGIAHVGGARSIWIGEGADPFADDHDPDLTRHRRFEGFAGIKIMALPDGPSGSVRIARTRAGTCPLYVSAASGALVASWRFEEVAASLPDRRPDVDACRSFLRHGTRPMRDQILRGMRMLWPGELLIHSAEGLEIRDAEASLVALPGTVRDDARVTERFLELVAASMGDLLLRSKAPLLELSGGHDSSCAAIAAGMVRSGLSSYAVVHEGAMGAQQARRREEIVRLLGLQDHVGPSHIPGPYASLDVPECRVTTFDDVYRMPCVNAVDAHPSGPFDLVVTGIGGDELALAGNHRREADEVPGHLPASSADAAAGRCDMFMRRGIWPCQPFTSPAVVDFCRALPERYRSGRMLNILTLARAGLSDGYVFPRLAENYRESGRREAYLVDFDELFAGGSVVGDWGIFDVNSILTRARQEAGRGLAPELTLQLWFLLKLERVLRTYVG